MGSHTQKPVCADTHTRTVTQSVWIKRRERERERERVRRYPSAGGGQANTLASHHSVDIFILLSELFQNPPPKRLLGFAQQWETPQRLLLRFTQELALTPHVRQNCVSDKRKRTEPKKKKKKSFLSLLFNESGDHLMCCRRCGASSATFYLKKVKKKVNLQRRPHTFGGICKSEKTT